MSNQKTIIRSVYDFCPPFGLVPEGNSMTQQHFKEEVDINAIMERADRGVFPDSGDRGNMQFGDFSMVDNYQSAIHAIQEADEAFMDLPAKVRIRFDNNPALLLNFLNDPNNRGEAIELGLIDKPVIIPDAAKEPPKATETPKSTVST